VTAKSHDTLSTPPSLASAGCLPPDRPDRR
jgi:hypothetical protein